MMNRTDLGPGQMLTRVHEAIFLVALLVVYSNGYRLHIAFKKQCHGSCTCVVALSQLEKLASFFKSRGRFALLSLILDYQSSLPPVR